MAKKSNINFEIPAFVLGIIAIVQAIFSPLSGLALGIIGMVLSKKQKTEMSERGRKLNLIAIIIGAVLFVAMIILTVISYGWSGILRY